MTCGIYKITNKLDGKAYIGASSNIEERWAAHKRNSSSSRRYLKQGFENFIFEIVEVCLKEELRDKERYYIKLFDTKIPRGYNLTDGGELPFNTTGFFRVHKHRDNNCTQGFFYVYQYSEKGVPFQITATDLNKLKEKVKVKGLEWKILNKELSKETMKSNEENMLKISYENDSTGFYRVSKTNSKIWGYYYKYYYKEGNQPTSLQSVNIRVLKKNVEEKGLPWKISDEEKAKQTLKESDENNMDRQNSTGYYNMSLMKEPRVKQGFVYRYHYRIDGKTKSIMSVDLERLEQKVKEKNLPWFIVNEELAKNTRDKLNQTGSQKSLNDL